MHTVTDQWPGVSPIARFVVAAALLQVAVALVHNVGRPKSTCAYDGASGVDLKHTVGPQMSIRSII